MATPDGVGRPPHLEWRTLLLLQSCAHENSAWMERTVDMETGEVLAVAVQTMAGGGTASSPVMLEASGRGLDRLGLEASEVVADGSCHSICHDGGRPVCGDCAAM